MIYYDTPITNENELLDEFNCLNYPSQRTLEIYNTYYELYSSIRGYKDSGFLNVKDYRMTLGQFQPRDWINSQTKKLYEPLLKMIDYIKKHDNYTLGFSNYYDFDFVKKRELQRQSKRDAILEEKAIRGVEKRKKNYEWDVPDFNIKRIHSVSLLAEPENIINFLCLRYNLTSGFGFGLAVPISLIPNFQEINSTQISIFKNKINNLDVGANSINDYNKLFNEIIDYIKTTVKKYDVSKQSLFNKLFYKKVINRNNASFELKDSEIKSYLKKYKYLFADEAPYDENLKLDKILENTIRNHVFNNNEFQKLLNLIHNHTELELECDIDNINKKLTKKLTKKEFLNLTPEKYQELILEAKEKKEQDRRDILFKDLKRIRTRNENQKLIDKKVLFKKSSVEKVLSKNIGILDDECEYSGIYLIVNNITYDFYIGESQNLTYRRLTHFGNLIDPKKKHPRSLMQDHFNKFGATSFDFYVLERIYNDTTEGIARKTIEAFFIKEYNPTYNVT